MNEFLLVGIEYGDYNGVKWAKAHLLESIPADRGRGQKAYYRKDQKVGRLDYNLAMVLLKDWELYENQKVCCSCDMSGRINSVTLAG